MFELKSVPTGSKPEFYRQLAVQLRALLEGETDPIANAANTSSLIYHAVPELNWAGFYVMREGELVLGPFQGKPACVRIQIGKGVCGTAALLRRPVMVDNVLDFPGHIACDSASRSELVVPVLHFGELFGVLDLDSPLFDRFDHHDQEGVEKLVEVFVEATNFPAHSQPR